MHLFSYLKNLKIRVKLSFSFAVMVLLMCVIGYSGYNGVHHVMKNLEEIFDVRLPSIDYLLQADRDLQQLLVAERSMIFANAKSDVFKELVAEYENNFKQSQERWEKYKALPTSPEEEAIIPLYDKARIEWETISRQVVDGRIADTRQGRSVALDLSLGQAKAKFEEMRDHLDKLTEINQNLATQAKKSAADSFRQAVLMQLVILAIGILTGIVMAWVISRNITRPVNDAVAGLRDIAEGEGDLTKRLEIHSRDEVGELATWFNTFLDKLQAIIKEITDKAKQLGASSDSLSSLSTQMSSGADNMSVKSDTVASAAEVMSVSVQSVAAAMEQASTNVNMVAAATEEMTSTVNEIAEQSEKGRSIANDAVSKANNTSVKVNELGEAAKAINQVTEVITEISEQTNLLALNATIEAARAGEAGKGFAVVANEIKELAKQTAQATQEIKSKIAGIQDSTSVTVDEIGQITRVINDVNDIVATIASATEEQLAATKEIAGNIGQASTGIQEVNENLSQSSAVSTGIAKDILDVNQESAEMSNSSSQINMSAKDLSTLADELNSMVGRFKI
jgi:methyl-accepting chemotaxis protein